MDDLNLLHELAPVAERLLERHLGTAKEWMPHELVPWGRGRDFVPGEVWEPSESSPPPAVRSALFVNLLTEDNLPYYYGSIHDAFGVDHPWAEWSRRWTAEEMRHAIVIRDYVVVTRSIDPVALERGRMLQVSGGEVPAPASASDTLVYVALQELATRIAHRNTGKMLADPVGYDVMARVAADENLHHLFYRDLVSAAIEVDPSSMVESMAKQVRQFHMPGTGIPDFARHARAIAAAGIYDLRAFLDQVVVPVVINQWRLGAIEGLSATAEKARVSLFGYLERLERVARRAESRRPAPVLNPAR